VAALLWSGEPCRADDEEDVASQAKPGLLGAAQRVLDAHAQFSEVLAPALTTLDGLGETVGYSGVDAWRHGGSLYAGGDLVNGKWALRLFAAAGADEFRSPTDAYLSATARASLMPGFHVQFGRLDIKAFAGGDYMLRQPLFPYLDPATEKFGARVSLDAWWQPAARWMVSGAVSATTVERGVSGRIASGWRSPFGWIGPEVLATHDIYNTQFRAGAHVSGLNLGFGEWSLAAGFARDSYGREGAYGRFSVTYRPPLPEGF
jgi:hypothetical protein